MAASECRTTRTYFKISMQSRQLFPSFEVSRKLPVNYDTMYAGKESFIHSKELFPPVNIYELENAYVSPYGVVFKNGKIIKESVYGMFDPKKQWPSFIKKILLGKTRMLDEPGLVTHHAFYENYYHWLCEIMPRIFVAVNALKNESVALLMHEKQPAFVRELVSLFYFKKIIYVRDDEIVKVPKLYFPSHIARPLAYHPAVMLDYSKWLQEKLNDPSLEHSPEKIFISRKNARYRITHNEDKIQAWLEAQGFAAIAPENYTVREQLNLFKKARIIIGSHGAGFSNLVFAPYCELIVDIIHREHPQDCFYNLANVFGTDYYYFQCEGKGALAYKNNDDVVADPDQFINEVGKRLI